VVVVVIDTLRWDRTTVHGHTRDTTPHLATLAADATLYERAYAQAPWTTPSIGSLLSSRYPSDLGIQHYRRALPDDAVMLAEPLQQAGFRTGAVVSHSYCATEWGFQQGFDSFDQAAIGDPDDESSAQVTDTALAFLREVGDQPFFLFVHYFDPHFAYLDHDGFGFAAAPDYQGPIRSGLRIRKLRKLVPGLQADDWDELLRLYDLEIAHTDQQIGRLVAGMKELGLYDDSLLVVTADHGEEFGDHGRWGHTVRLHDEVVRVPLMVRYPGDTPARVQRPVALVDVMPTLLAALDLPGPDGMVGADLRAPAAQPRPVFTETSKGARMDAVVMGRHKLIRDHEADTWALYDLEADPREQTELAAAHPEVLGELQGLLDGWRGRATDGTVSGDRVEISAEDAARLEALGYLEND
jgi:arylsulfatase A-like enzyme